MAGMKLAVTGKGGVGKTTVAGTLARLLAARGLRVYAVDADPDANLGSALGAPGQELASLAPLARMGDLVAERVGSPGGFFRLNPKVDDLPESISLDIDGVRLLVLGSVEKGGAGCICPESAMLKALVRYLVIEVNDVVILDMEAGIEHLGRGTASYVDAFVVVAEPGKRSAQTASTVSKLAAELGVESCFLVVNKVRSTEEASAVSNALPELAYLGSISESEAIRAADVAGVPCDDPLFVKELLSLKEALVKKVKNAKGLGLEINAV